MRAFLPHANFHHFLGYARNYGKLVSAGRVAPDTSLNAVVSIIETDRQVSTILYQAFQSYEHQLRALLVDAHCDLFSPYSCFFDESHYQAMNSIRRNPAQEVIKQTLRMKEPFVSDRLERYMREHGLYGRPENMSEVHQREAVDQFPIWSIVDGLTFGCLTDLILNRRKVGSGTEPARILDAVAEGSGVHKKAFESQIRGLLLLRNLIAHHARLWMRPTLNPPPTPRPFMKACRDMSSNSMYVAWMTLAHHLRDAGDGRKLAESIDNILQDNLAYSAGVKLPRPAKS